MNGTRGLGGSVFTGPAGAAAFAGRAKECAAATTPPPARLKPIPMAASLIPPPLGRRGRRMRGGGFGSKREQAGLLEQPLAQVALEFQTGSR